MKKLIALLFMFTLLSNGLVISQIKLTQDQIDRISRIECKLMFNGDALVGVGPDGNTDFNRISTLPPVAVLFTSPFSMTYGSDFITTATFTPTGGESIYDIQSNSTPAQLWQNPGNAGEIHAVYMTAPYGNTSFSLRRTNYYYSADTGTTWAFINEVPSTNLKSGYCTITGMSDGNILVANHSVVPPPTPYRTQIYADIFPGLGSWVNLDPPLMGHQQCEWPRIVATSNIANPNKFVFLSSCNPANFTSNDDSTFYNVGTSLTSPGTFAGWTFISSDNAERYAIAKGDGKIGIAFFVNLRLAPADNGDVFFIESTDDGNTFSTPLKIFNAQIFPATTDSLGASSGLSIIYQGSEPKVVFGTATLSTVNPGNYYPGAYARIRFWSPTLPGTDPDKSIVIADSNNVSWNPYVWPGTNADGLSGICKPSIGISADDNVLFVAFMSASSEVGGTVDTLSFFDVYLTASGDIGDTWKTPVKLTPDSPRRDWAFTSMSPYNDHSTTNWYANLVVQSDTIPGSYVNHTANGQSLAQLMFVRVEISKDSIVSVKNISNEIPGEYRLQQNYPNPFNPSTTIRFNIPNTSNVTLKIYNINGQEIATLINNEVVSAGIKEIDFNAVNLSSGIYFYTLKAGDFRDTKKMILLK